MTFYRNEELPLSDGDLVFRESPWMKLLGALMCFGFAAAPICVGRFGHRTGIARWLLPPVGAFVLLIAVFFFRVFLKTLGPENWLFRITGGGVLIQYRTYLNSHLPAEDPIAFSLATDEVHWVRKAVNRSVMPTQSHRQIETYLEVGVDPVITSELEKRLAYERTRQAGIRSLFYPVRVSEPGVIRIQWRSSTTWVTPFVERALDVLGERNIRVDAPHESKLNLVTIAPDDPALPERIRELAESGNIFE